MLGFEKKDKGTCLKRAEEQRDLSKYVIKTSRTIPPRKMIPHWVRNKNRTAAPSNFI